MVGNIKNNQKNRNWKIKNKLKMQNDYKKKSKTKRNWNTMGKIKVK